MHRFHVSSKDISSEQIVISDKELIHHIKDVLRLKEKDSVVIFDDMGDEYSAAIKRLLPQEIILKVIRKQEERALSKFSIAIACAIPKKCKMDDIIDKLTQLGVDKIIPMETERVIVKLDKRKKAARLLRWRKIALSAAEQSQRRVVPTVEPIKDIKNVLSEAGSYDLKIIPALIGERRALKDILAPSQAKNILVLIGPEGDFTPQEVELAKGADCIPVTLGELVFRVDTAAIAVASFIKLYADS